MAKLIAVIHTIAWGTFWAFGFLALTTPPAQSGLLVAETLLAAAGAATGMWTWFWLVRRSEATGYAKPRNRVQAPDDLAAA